MQSKIHLGVGEGATEMFCERWVNDNLEKYIYVSFSYSDIKKLFV